MSSPSGQPSVGRATRVVALTLIGVAAIVPALLARRWVDANATLANAEKLRASLDSPEPRASGDGAEPDAADPTRRIESALAPPRPVSSADQVRFFSRDEIEQANATQTKAPQSKGNLLPPIAVAATPAESRNDASSKPSSSQVSGAAPPPNLAKPAFGVLVTWKDNPMNPAGTVVRHQVYRWSERERPAAIHTSPEEKLGKGGDPSGANETVESHEYLDATACPGTRVMYAVRTIQLDKLEGVEVRRSALSEGVTVDVPTLFEIEAVGFSDSNDPLGLEGSDPAASANGFPIIRLSIRDLRVSPPIRREIRVVASEDQGHDIGVRDLGFEIGWTLLSLDRELRQETTDVSVPVFAADGSRKIDGGVPVTAPRKVTQQKAYPVVRLRDRCGNEKVARVAKPSR
jgi:hypothetical protein